MASPSDRDNHLACVFDLLDRLFTLQSEDDFEATSLALRALNVPEVNHVLRVMDCTMHDTKPKARWMFSFRFRECRCEHYGRLCPDCKYLLRDVLSQTNAEARRLFMERVRAFVRDAVLAIFDQQQAAAGSTRSFVFSYGGTSGVSANQGAAVSSVQRVTRSPTLSQTLQHTTFQQSEARVVLPAPIVGLTNALPEARVVQPPIVDLTNALPEARVEQPPIVDLTNALPEARGRGRGRGRGGIVRSIATSGIVPVSSSSFTNVYALTAAPSTGLSSATRQPEVAVSQPEVAVNQPEVAANPFAAVLAVPAQPAQLIDVDCPNPQCALLRQQRDDCFEERAQLRQEVQGLLNSVDILQERDLAQDMKIYGLEQADLELRARVHGLEQANVGLERANMELRLESGVSRARVHGLEQANVELRVNVGELQEQMLAINRRLGIVV